MKDFENNKTNLLELKKVSYKYNEDVFAIKDISMVFKEGMSTAVIGANGAGKSTLLLTLNGIHKPIEGKVIYNGKEVFYNKKDIVNLRKEVGIVFQNPDNQLFSSSVIEDISFGAINLGLPMEEVKKRVEDALIKTSIVDLKDKPTHSLSYGQKKRVAIAGVLVMEPKIIILDEPTAGLDPSGVSEIMDLLNELKEKMHLTIIISTHDMDIIPLYSDYTYVLQKGTIFDEGPTEEVFNRPENLRKAGLRLPRIGHLMEILMKKDGFDFSKIGNTISDARKIINEWKEINNTKKSQ